MQVKFLTKSFYWFILFFFFFAIPIQGTAGGWLNFKLGYSNNRTAIPSKTTISIKGEANIRFFTHFEAGFYLGVGGYLNIVEQTANSFSVSYHSSNIYGVQTAFQILPLFSNDSTLRLDFYLTGKLGGINVWNKNLQNTPHKYFSDWGIYLGASYYIRENWGIYAELGKGSYTLLRYGLTFKF